MQENQQLTHHQEQYTCESYAHLYAKQVVADWFREKFGINRKKGRRNSYYIFDWIPDWGDLQGGVMLEYPVLERTLTNGQKDYLGLASQWSKYPDLNQLNDGLKVACVFDVVVCSNGKVRYVFEIVHKHKCSPRKIALLKLFKLQHGIDVYEVNASWVLNQIKRPPLMENTHLTP